jgi:murein DD-endopeptidase MepM/ murein hydrolase activator NlpD
MFAGMTVNNVRMINRRRLHISGILLLCLLLLPGLAAGQLEGLFISPMKRDIRLSGTFAELRSNHFHAGLDIKSLNHSNGDPVYAIADGFICNIMIHPSGYGNAIMIQHDNGFTSVYAHLDKFDKEVEKLVLKYQIIEKEYALDVEIPAHEFRVIQGQKIGYMGNTGFSFGPHLHFEIRRTENNMLINPLIAGYSIDDKVPPEMHLLRVYGLDHKRRQTYAKNFNVIKKNGQYGISGDTLYVPADRAALALSTIDKTTGLHHRNGIYKLQMFVDDSLYFSYQMDSFPRADTRALNAHSDFEQYMFAGNSFHRLHRLPGNPLNVYPYLKNDGLILLKDDKPREIKIFSYDFSGNFSMAKLFLKRDQKTTEFKVPETYYLLYHDKENLIRTDDLEIFFPEKTLYENVYFELFEQKGPSYGVYSKYYRLHTSREPLHSNIEIRIKPFDMPDHLKDKAFLAYCLGRTTYNHGGIWDGEFFKGPTHQLGEFCIMIDTIPPVIKATRFSKAAGNISEFRFSIWDDFAPSRHFKKWRIHVWLNEEWLPAEFDSRRNTLIVPIQQLGKGEHSIRVEAEDCMGNVRVWEERFRK